MRIAIVGGGAAAVALANRLVSHHSAALDEICVYEPAPDIGPGRAYQADISDALVNLPNAGMSIDADEPDDLLHWLARSPMSAADAPRGPHDFLPRATYGRYLRYCFVRTQHQGAVRGLAVRAVHQAVTRVTTNETGAVVHTAGGQRFAHDRVVLCLGTSAPDNAYGLPAARSFVADPYPLKDSLPTVPDGAHALVVGTGLTAVDVACALLRRRPNATVTMASRRGVLPGVRNPEVWTTARHSTPERFAELCDEGGIRTLADVWDFVEAELRLRGLPVREARKEWLLHDGGLRRLARQAAAVHKGSQWRDVAIATLNPVVSQAWQALPSDQRRLFAAHWSPAYTSFMNPMPPQTAEFLLAAQQAGRLRVLSGMTGLTERVGGGYTVHSTDGTYHADLAVNAVNASPHAITERAGSLLAGLLADGQATRNAFGGIAVDVASGSVRSAAGQACPHLYALGQLTIGENLLTNSVRAIVRQSAVLARALTQAAQPSVTA